MPRVLRTRCPTCAVPPGRLCRRVGSTHPADEYANGYTHAERRRRTLLKGKLTLIECA